MVPVIGWVRVKHYFRQNVDEDRVYCYKQHKRNLGSAQKILFSAFRGLTPLALLAAALREAVLNALIHRDYAVPAPIQIRVYRDKLHIWNPAVLAEDWTLDRLLKPHSSRPYNPLVANTFFRAGEIEAWGRGIQRIFDACREAHTPKPVLTLQSSDLWLEFPFSKTYLQAVDVAESSNDSLDTMTRASGKGSGKSSGKGSGKTSDRILIMLTNDPHLTIPELAETLQLSTRAIEKQINRLQSINRLRRIGPAKGGHWKVVDP
jgi:ATP-dependent DNA helicase RecG